jgi:pimeloyl-ACP methyl ester carboxylesterase
MAGPGRMAKIPIMRSTNPSLVRAVALAARPVSPVDLRFAAAVAVGALLVTGCAPRGFYALPDAPAATPTATVTASAPAAIPLDGQCPKVRGEGPVVLLVPGIGGETENVTQVREELAGLSPSAMLSFHWSPFEESQSLVRRLTDGLTQLARCVPPGRTVVVVAHSAGGVLASMAAGGVRLAPAGKREVVLVTVASPLAGAGYSSWRTRLLPIKPFALTVGGKVERYSAPPAGLRVVHVRTHAAADHVMRETESGHRPDDPRAIVPGAKLHELPEHVGHDDALLWAARALTEEPQAFGLDERRLARD